MDYDDLLPPISGLTRSFRGVVFTAFVTRRTLDIWWEGDNGTSTPYVRKGVRGCGRGGRDVSCFPHRATILLPHPHPPRLPPPTLAHIRPTQFPKGEYMRLKAHLKPKNDDGGLSRDNASAWMTCYLDGQDQVEVDGIEGPEVRTSDSALFEPCASDRCL